MAREKNTTRAIARRRGRVAARASIAADDAVLTSASSDNAKAEQSDPPRRSFFPIPDFREDIRQLPDMFRAKPLLWLPFGLLLAGVPITVVIPTPVPPGDATWFVLGTYWQMVFLPQGLVTYLLAGYLAPRGSYLVGLLLGLFNAVLLVLTLVLLRPAGVLADNAADQQSITVLFVGYSIIVGPIVAGFAAWYRGFLNRIGAQGKQRRLDREAEATRQKREQRREDRRAAKRPVNS